MDYKISREPICFAHHFSSFEVTNVDSLNKNCKRCNCISLATNRQTDMHHISVNTLIYFNYISNHCLYFFTFSSLSTKIGSPCT